jgi:hypothetical protein
MTSARRFLLSTSISLLFFVLAAPQVFASTISGTVKDPSGAVIAGANIEISGGELTQPVVVVSDGLGQFTSPDLKPGKYLLKVARAGFETLQRAVDLEAPAQLELTLAIARAETNIAVSEKALGFANSDPVYRQLRNLGVGESFQVDGFEMVIDAATIEFRKGTLTFLSPVNGMVTGAIFDGDAHFNLKPALALDQHELERRTGAAEVNEEFAEAVFRFSNRLQKNFQRGVKEHADTPPQAAAVLEHWREGARRRREIPLGFSEALLTGEGMDNVDADVLASVYNEAHPTFLNAYIRGAKHKDLRFFVRAKVGAIPQLDSSEEVGLVNYNPEGMDDGVWYLSHLKSEFQSGSASSEEDRRLFATRRYKIETVIGKNRHLTSLATITFAPQVAGERVLKFDLLPNLRVTRVADAQGQSLYFIQESRKEDGSFYVILPAAPAMGKEVSISVEYSGDKVLESAGDGSFYVLARTSWYPNLNGFGEHALYDLTFKVPHQYKVISIGKLESESREQDYAVTHWVTPIPVAVAGFNYGSYQKVDIADDIDHYNIAGYYLSELPGNLRNYSALSSMAPHSMTEYALQQTRAQLQLCTYYFGKIPYLDVSITEQPDFNFGQSWPNLIYLPISAYTDSTQRWMLFGNINTKFTGFVQEVTPHEVAHQWWGHAVGWASYHDQWLSEGFAEFSAGLFLQQAVGKNWKDDYLKFWERLRVRILEKNNFGIAPNDAGPLWMGLRLISPKSENGYQDVTYPKGAYVLGMLRSIMRATDSKEPDAEFIAMMHEFVDTHKDAPASTESFKKIAEKHMTRLMDAQHNGRLDWFFDEWVYGTKVPRYEFTYKTSPGDGGTVKLHMSLTQSEVDDKFFMLVPVFVDFGEGWVRIGQVGVIGNSTREADVMLPKAPRKVMLNALKEILQR